MNITDNNNKNTLEYINYIVKITTECNRLGILSPFNNNLFVKDIDKMYKFLFSKQISARADNFNLCADNFGDSNFYIIILKKDLNMYWCEAEAEANIKIKNNILNILNYTPNTKMVSINDHQANVIFQNQNLLKNNIGTMYTFISENTSHEHTFPKGTMFFSICKNYNCSYIS